MWNSVTHSDEIWQEKTTCGVVMGEKTREGPVMCLIEFKLNGV